MSTVPVGESVADAVAHSGTDNGTDNGVAAPEAAPVTDAPAASAVTDAPAASPVADAAAAAAPVNDASGDDAPAAAAAPVIDAAVTDAPAAAAPAAAPEAAAPATTAQVAAAPAAAPGGGEAAVRPVTVYAASSAAVDPTYVAAAKPPGRWRRSRPRRPRSRGGERSGVFGGQGRGELVHCLNTGGEFLRPLRWMESSCAPKGRIMAGRWFPSLPLPEDWRLAQGPQSMGTPPPEGLCKRRRPPAVTWGG